MSPEQPAPLWLTVTVWLTMSVVLWSLVLAGAYLVSLLFNN
jgi:hypothetical protein